MRLIDRPVERLTEARHVGNNPNGRMIPFAFHASEASVRYVLDIEASNACGELVRCGDGLFEADNPLFRMPAETFWVELFGERAPTMSGPNKRIGYLVHAATDGRSGTITPFSETSEGLSRRLPCEIRFDLDGKMVREPGMYHLRHPHMPHLAPLLEHSMLHPDPEGLKTLRTRAGANSTVLGELAEGTWFALPLLFAFVALLNSPQVVETRHSDLARLNRARSRRGRLPLLDHVEVRLTLGETSGTGGVGGSFRSAPRLHFVRGHVVRRHGKTFWRQSHLRGDSQKAIVSKTVRVTAGRSVRSDAARHVRTAVNSS